MGTLNRNLLELLRNLGHFGTTDDYVDLARNIRGVSAASATSDPYRRPGVVEVSARVDWIAYLLGGRGRIRRELVEALEVVRPCTATVEVSVRRPWEAL